MKFIIRDGVLSISPEVVENTSWIYWEVEGTPYVQIEYGIFSGEEISYEGDLFEIIPLLREFRKKDLIALGILPATMPEHRIFYHPSRDEVRSYTVYLIEWDEEPKNRHTPIVSGSVTNRSRENHLEILDKVFEFACALSESPDSEIETEKTRFLTWSSRSFMDLHSTSEYQKSSWESCEPGRILEILTQDHLRVTFG